ncbi:MAG: spore germination protein [Tuberibacillus sp.]
MIKILKRSSRKKNKREQKTNSVKSASQNDKLSEVLDENYKKLQTVYSNSSDVIFRRFTIGGKINAVLVYIQGLSDFEEIDRSVLTPLMEPAYEECPDLREIIEHKLTVSDVKEVTTIADTIDQIASGNPVILVDRHSFGVALGLAKWEKRSIEEPTAESVVRGPREGFTETIIVNTSLLRRKIKNPNLKMKSLKIGKQTKTQVILTYIETLVDPTLVEEVTNRLKRIDIDGILESGYIEEFIEDNPYSPFPQVLTTERPDVASASLLEGRVAILVDGTPFVIIVPVTLYSLLQAPDDYYQRFMIGTLIRWLRYLFLLIALTLPSLYVAILTFHQEMIPTSLLLTIAKTREEVPFPALVEALIMEVTFEILREAGLRLPKQIGSAVSIVGALVIGDAAVNSGLVSAPMVMVVAITGIASFAIPRYNAAIAFRMLRFPIIFLAGTLGLLGIMLTLIAIIIHLSSLRSFGVPYLSPFAPLDGSEMKDSLFRAPLWSLRKRPHFTGKYNRLRQPSGQKPNPLK